ncbi:MAG: hypothetical protein EVA79_04895 [Prochlorococcus sp. MED-G132]|nr:MAG: hypothetical protein EVA79_04895 [Prochlorococcus sp. MED-G132]
MAAVRFLSAVLALSLTLASCESSSQKATNDEIKVAEGAELVCSARNQVDQAVAVVNALTPESTIAQAEFSEYRDQIFRDAVDEIREKKDLTLAEAADQLKGKVAPVIAAREQLMATTVCIDVEQSAKGESEDEDDSEDE